MKSLSQKINESLNESAEALNENYSQDVNDCIDEIIDGKAKSQKISRDEIKSVANSNGVAHDIDKIIKELKSKGYSVDESVNEGSESKSDLEQKLKDLNAKISQWKGKRQNSIHPFDPQKKVSDYVAMLNGFKVNLEKQIATLNESLINESKVRLDTTEIGTSLKSFMKKNNIKYVIKKEHGDAGGNMDVEYTGSKEALTLLITDMWEDEHLLQYITENVNEDKKSDSYVTLLKQGFDTLSDDDYKKLYGITKETGKANIKKFSPDIYKEIFESIEENINESEITTDEQFKEYVETVLKEAHGDDYDQDKADKTAESILKDADGDYGAAIGMLTSSLGESLHPVITPQSNDDGISIRTEDKK